jgi:valyl-tRNA synthetase
MSGYSEMGEQPFSDVLIHGLIRDVQGRKMSKSLGNGVDPLEVIDQYGADVLRITLITGNKMGNDARWNTEKLEANRNFMNKLYNAAKFILMNTYDYVPCEYTDIKSSLSLSDKWIIGKLSELISEINTNMEKYEFGLAAEKLYDFVWNVFCDWYIELSKTSLYNKEDERYKRSAQFTLKYVFSCVLKMLHPFIPFITEELYLALNVNKETIMIQKWPSFDENMTFDEARKDMDIIIEAVRSIRNARSTMNIAPSKRAELYLECDHIRVREMLKENENYFKALCSAKSILFEKPLSENIISAVFSSGKFLIPLDDLIDKEKERERLLKEKVNIQKELKLAESKLNNTGFMAKAPESVVLAEKEKQQKYTTMLEEVAERLSKLS